MDHKKKKKKDDLSSSKPQHGLRIADILLDQEEPDLTEMEEQRRKRDDQPTMIVQCSTPHRIISRWFSALKRGKPKITSRLSHKTTTTTVVNTDLLHTTDDGGSAAGRGGKESFNLGVACGLLYVIAAAGKNELNKMVDLRKEMELILEDAKNELNKSMDYSNIDDNNLAASFSTTNFQQAPTSSQFSLQSAAVAIADDDDNDDDEVEEGQETGMDQLEAELQTELERLELLHLDSETDSKSPHQQTIKEEDDDDDDDDDDESGTSCGEVMDVEYSDELLWGCGVCPVELERKLHRVLEERQEARIKELEHALKCAQHKLRKKEIEVSSLSE